MADDGEPRKRSRFDQTSAEPAKKSRFDRRSRSPAREEAEAKRSRSPASKAGDEDVQSPGAKAKRDAMKAAEEAAARINASLKAKTTVQKVDVPPVRSASDAASNPGGAQSPSDKTGEVYQQDGDFIKDIEVNDLRNRYTVTKGSTQKMISEKTGADVTTRGNYYPDKSMATPEKPPLYLHVTAVSKEILEKAVTYINELLTQELPNLIDERRFRRTREPDPVERDSQGRRKWPEERIPIDLEPIPGFNLRAQVVGPQGANVKHIQGESRCRVQIKGRGSGFIEHDTGMESDEQMYLHVAGPDADGVASAKEMCLSLLEVVTNDYNDFKARGMRPNHGPRPSQGDGYNNGPQRYNGNGQRPGWENDNAGPRDNNGGGYGGAGYGQQQYVNPAAPMGSYTTNPQQPQGAYPAQQQYGQDGGAAGMAGAAANTDPAVTAAWIQYYTENPDIDPYKSYGGYAAVLAYYAQQQQQQQQQQQPQQGYGQSPVGGGGYGQPQEAPPPPPPPQDDAPPPPPPGA